MELPAPSLPEMLHDGSSCCTAQIQLSSLGSAVSLSSESLDSIYTMTLWKAENLIRVSLDQNIDMHQIQTLPLNGRNITSLTALTPGVSTYPQSNIDLYGTGTDHGVGGTTYVVGGQFEGSVADNGYYINGLNATENYQDGINYAIPPDAVQDVRIAVSDFSAASGHDIS